MRFVRYVLALICAIFSLTAAASRSVRSDVHVIVVVNGSNAITVLHRDRLAKIFLRQIADWDNGTEIMPVDQIEKSAARAAFSREVLGKSVSALKIYWQELIFTGNESPPPERVNDADVITYVRSNSGAIGYVVEGTDLGTGVRAVAVAP